MANLFEPNINEIKNYIQKLANDAEAKYKMYEECMHRVEDFVKHNKLGLASLEHDNALYYLNDAFGIDDCIMYFCMRHRIDVKWKHVGDGHFIVDKIEAH